MSCIEKLSETSCLTATGPLAGYRVIELCSTIAGPACARLMGDFGAEVIKVEPREGDSVRSIGGQDKGVSLYGSAILRNKEAVSINIKTEAGRDLLLKLINEADIVVENFRPGTLERLNLGYDVLSKDNPKLVLVRISGYGQTGPYAAKPGYGAICEAFAGVRHMTGDPDRPPSRTALAATDYLTSVYAAFGAMMALLNAQKTGVGQVVDAALYEAAFSMMESVVPDYDRTGVVPMRQGSRLPGTAPNNLYRGSDGNYVLIAANNDAVFKRMARAMDRADLLEDPRYTTIRGRNTNHEALDAEVAEWATTVTAREAAERMEAAGVPTSLVYTIADIFEDPHFRERDMLVPVPHETLGEVTVAGVVPKLSATPGSIRHLGHEVGEDTFAVLQRVLGISDNALHDLARDGAIMQHGLDAFDERKAVRA
ncbi:CaiB/BaiF CoA transferase family protein [Aquamicrobium zhengzhouense]|uniref:CoA transferase n=1 Tax=Aquamicrobium zhengzhouense TaxID=2781738 RepID=A0ABS0SEJ6_9HYPH|nr:CoA transferase [Aquamicrobium zhengzhouense]MBI1621666.1 CoA transferase [Aquamicrobium zhengzhouense]